ncbi:MAG: hypothetical protein ACLPY1_24975 [Terracidiphilus sp.]
MNTVSLDEKVLFAGTVIETAIIGLLLYRRVWRTLPIFCVYVFWSLLTDWGDFIVQRQFRDQSSHTYLIIYIVSTVVDSALQISVLIELAWSVLRPLRSSLSRKALIWVALLVLALGAAIWPFSGMHELASLPPAWRNLAHVQQVASILRILFFLGLAGCSQLLSIGWRDRELQVATGLGFYSLVGLAVALWRSHEGMRSEYLLLNRILTASYFCSLLYWAFSFAQKEAERREFTPQMQSFLLAVAGNARTTRIALANSAPPEERGRRE